MDYNPVMYPKKGSLRLLLRALVPELKIGGKRPRALLNLAVADWMGDGELLLIPPKLAQNYHQGAKLGAAQVLNIVQFGSGPRLEEYPKVRFIAFNAEHSSSVYGTNYVLIEWVTKPKTPTSQAPAELIGLFIEPKDVAHLPEFEPGPATLAELRKACHSLRLTASFKNGEYRLAPMFGKPGDKEDAASYSPDLEDAWGTAQHMASHIKEDARFAVPQF